MIILGFRYINLRYVAADAHIRNNEEREKFTEEVYTTTRFSKLEISRNLLRIETT